MPRSLLLSALVLAAAGCGSSAPSVASGPVDSTQIDGDAADWSGALTRLDDDRLAVGVRNDGDRLAVAVVTSDRDAIRHTFLTGLTVWVDAGGGTERAYGVQFPVGLVGDGRVDLAAMREAGQGGERDVQARFERMLDRVAVVSDGQRRVYGRADAPDVVADARLEGGQLVMELSVPLAAVGARPGQTIGVGVETPELDRDALREQVRAQMGQRGGGNGGGRAGRRGGRRGGGAAGRRGSGERPSPPEPVQAWVRATLAG